MPNYAGWSYETDQALTEFDGFKIFYADATDETKIRHDKIRPLILSKQFQFCPLVRKGSGSYLIIYPEERLQRSMGAL